MVLFGYFIYLIIVCGVLTSIASQDKYIGSIYLLGLTLAYSLTMGLIDNIYIMCIIIIFVISCAITHIYFNLEDTAKKAFIHLFFAIFILVSISQLVLYGLT